MKNRRKKTRDRYFSRSKLLFFVLPFVFAVTMNDNAALSPPKASNVKQSSLASILSLDKKKEGEEERNEREREKLQVTSVVANKSQQRDPCFFSSWRDLIFSTSPGEMITTRRGSSWTKQISCLLRSRGIPHSVIFFNYEMLIDYSKIFQS